MNWKKFQSTAYAYIQKTLFFILLLNWKKLRGPLRATFENLKSALEMQPKTNTQKYQFPIYH